MARFTQTYTTVMGSQTITLPLAAIKPQQAIALLMVIEQPISVIFQAGHDLAAQLAPYHPDFIVGTATLGVPVAMAVAHALHVDDWAVLQKSQKHHLSDAVTEPLESVTTNAHQVLRLDQWDAQRMKGRRVALVDDVIASGSSVHAGMNLLRQTAAEVVAIGTFLTEAWSWHGQLDNFGVPIISLGHIPDFTIIDGIPEVIANTL